MGYIDRHNRLGIVDTFYVLLVEITVVKRINISIHHEIRNGFCFSDPTCYDTFVVSFEAFRLKCIYYKTTGELNKSF